MTALPPGSNGPSITTSSPSTQLLFFDTLTANSTSLEDLPTECIRFHQRVVLSEINIVPKNFKPFQNTRKSNFVGQTSPPKFDLHLLIHKTLTAEQPKSQDKRSVNLPLHPLTISYDERRGFQSYDVKLLPEATTRFIILRGDYQAVTLCIYGRVLESAKTLNTKSKDTTVSIELPISSQRMDLLQKWRNNGEIIVYSISPDENLSTRTLRCFLEDDYQISWKCLQTYTQQAKSLIDILDRDDFDQMDIEDSYIKNSRYNLTELLSSIADVIVEGCVWALNHEEPYVDVLNITEKAILFGCDLPSGKSSVKCMESSLAVFRKLCSCGSNIVESSLIWRCVDRIVELLSESNISTYVQSIILRNLLECMDDSRVVDRLLGWSNGDNGSNEGDVLYHKHIVNILYIPDRPTRVLYLVHDIVRKVGSYEACACIKKIAEDEDRVNSKFQKGKVKLERRKSANSVVDEGETPDTADNTPMTVDQEGAENDREDVDTVVNVLCEKLKIIYKAVLYHTALKPRENSSDRPSAFSFQYLTITGLFSSITTIISSERFKSSSKYDVLISYIGRVCVALMGTHSGMVYLAKQLQEVIPPHNERMIAVWMSQLRHLSEDSSAHYEDSSEASVPNTPSTTTERWNNNQDIRDTLGIADLWCGHWQTSTSRQILRMQSCGTIGADNDCLDRLETSPEHLAILLRYQMHAIGIVERLLLYIKHVSEDGNDGQDNEKILFLLTKLHELTVCNVGKQAVASAIIGLDALPSLLSLINISREAESSISASMATFASDISLELFELVVKHSAAFPFILSADLNDCVISTLATESHLRALWLPIATFHESGSIQSVVDIIKHQKYYPECLRDRNIVNQVLIGLRLLICYTYVDGGILQLLTARTDDFSGLDNGDSLIVFLLRLTRQAAEMLSDLSDSVVYSDHHTSSDSSQNSISKVYNTEESKGQEIKMPLTEQNKSESDKQDKLDKQDKDEQCHCELMPDDMPASNLSLMETIDLKADLLSLVSCNILLIRRLFRYVYEDRESNVSKRHFKNIFEEDETIDDTLPSQKGSMLLAFIESLLELTSALDRLDGHISKQLGGTTILHISQPPKRGQMAQIERLRELVLSMFRLLLQMVITERRSIGQGTSVCSRYLSEYAGRHIIQHLINFTFDAPENFLSGLILMCDLLPNLRELATSGDRGHEMSVNLASESRRANLNDFTANGGTADLLNALAVREYWTKQLLPLRDDIMNLVRCMAPSSSKIIHLKLRTVCCQLVDLDVNDAGLGRAIVDVMACGVREAAITLRSSLNRLESKRHNTSNNDDNELDNMEDVSISMPEMEKDESIFCRWLSLLNATVNVPCGRLCMLDVLNNRLDDAMEVDNAFKERKQNSDDSLLNILFDVVRSHSVSQVVGDLIMEFIYDICDHTLTMYHSNMFGVDEMSYILENLLEWVVQDSGHLQIRSLQILQKFTEIEMGLMLILSYESHRQSVSSLLTWVPEILRSNDLGLEDLNICLHSALFIQRIIDNAPDLATDDMTGSETINDTINDGNDCNVGCLMLLLDSIDDVETLLKSYENIEQRVLELPYEPRHSDEVYEVNTCQEVASVLRRLRESMHAYLLELKESGNKHQLLDIIEVYNSHFVQLIESNKKESNDVGDVRYRPNALRRTMFYDVADDAENKGGDGGIFGTSDIEIDFEAYAKEMLPNFHYHKGMRMSEGNANKGDKLLRTRGTVSKLGGIAYESNARRNLGGGKTYQKNEFRSIHNNRKANTSRPPSVHVDDFISGKIPANQQHPDMLTGNVTISTPSSAASLQQKKVTPTTRIQALKRGGIIPTSTQPVQTSVSIRGGRGRRLSTSSAPTARGVSRGASNAGRGGGVVGRGGNAGATIVGPWDMGNGAWAAGGPPTITPMLMPPPIPRYLDVDRRMEGREYARYDNQSMRTGYYDNQYYGMPMAPYERPPVQASQPGMAPRIKAGNDTRGRSIPEWPPRSIPSQPARRPERPFIRRG